MKDPRREAEVLIRSGYETGEVAKATGLTPQRVGAIRARLLRPDDERTERVRRLLGTWRLGTPPSPQRGRRT
jgi:hypothetical protein